MAEVGLVVVIFGCSGLKLNKFLVKNMRLSFLGSSKKKARADASKQALIELIGYESYVAVAEYSLREKPLKVTKNPPLDPDIIMLESGNGNKANTEYSCLAFADHVSK